MFTIQRLEAMEILDSRGRPTVQATCHLASGASASASVPSGASTGTAEALELRDNDPRRYHGKGCQKAVSHVNGPIHEALVGRTLASQQELDEALIALDGTPNKSRLGANAILAVSVAFARAAAAQRSVPLYQHFADLLGQPVQTMPRLTVNLFSGGKHAGQQVAIQDVLVVPTAARTIDESLVMVHNVYHAAAQFILQRYGMRLLTADEGGLAPPCQSEEAMIQEATEAIRQAGYEPGRDFALALDVASSHFYRDGRYHLGGRALTSREMIDLLRSWVERYPIVSVEDGLAEEDWEHWPLLRDAISGRALVLGDDLLCTQPKRISRAVETNACNALLLKVNQVGTLSESIQAYRLARQAGWHVTLSVRSGETEDHWAADLAVGWSADQFKNGSITQSERLAKYNRLLAIEAQHPLPIVRWPA